MPEMTDLSISEQQHLGQPIADSEPFSDQDQEFLNLILRLVDDGEIDLYVPSSLINQGIYGELPLEKQQKVEFHAVNLIGKIRQIYGLYKANPKPTYQLKNLVAALRLNKEELEAVHGDLFII